MRADPREGGGENVDRVQDIFGRDRAPGGGDDVDELADAHDRRLDRLLNPGRGPGVQSHTGFDDTTGDALEPAFRSGR
ncbi:hypothetical protein [Streptomyces albipurpureus]|uniref:Uncharacterized protein n=1 Tax=Streptomyces albipurpureus TaxID=2897419 RepID=A0ABT0UIB0_9ACTN|nr:hypothetical protein [Streptomyces sp. CWNU-1]MCM2388170.1 hypothetical protein [Streptomyces sp. CWNU-1]